MNTENLVIEIHKIYDSLESGNSEMAKSQVILLLRKLKAFQQNMHPTSEALLAKLELLTPEQLSALEVLLTPLACG